MMSLDPETLEYLAEEREVDTTTSAFRDALAKFTHNNFITEQRKGGARTWEQVRECSKRGLVAEFYVQGCPGFSPNLPPVDDVKKLDYEENLTDFFYGNDRVQVKSKKRSSRYWGISMSQYRSIQHSVPYNDYFLVVNVHENLASGFLYIPSKFVVPFIRSGYSYYYDHEAAENHPRVNCTLTLSRKAVIEEA